MTQQPEERYLTVVDENGEEQLCEILDTVYSERFDKNYVLYSLVGSEDEDGFVEIHAYAFVPSENGEDGELLPIETDEEWEFVEDFLAQREDELGEEDAE
ncbi:DUF1292 domain-containing protein [Lysinibacillus sp. KU-BSD001]|uniref:DUF1292 domain-containing protein n=1 Tax=Lysinibacillus sp. KU-BSD001 TaxID=3141328 RepID=UPI0036EA8CBB